MYIKYKENDYSCISFNIRNLINFREKKYPISSGKTSLTVTGNWNEIFIMRKYIRCYFILCNKIKRTLDYVKNPNKTTTKNQINKI